MIGALSIITGRQWRLHKLRLALTTAGISLGVAVFFGIQTTNTTLVDSLHNTIEKLAGKATLQITAGDSGFSEEYLKVVRATPGVALAEPVIETIVETTLSQNEKLMVLGLDTESDLRLYSDMFDEGGLVVSNPLAFTSRLDSIAISRKLADRQGLKQGSKLTVQTQSGPKEFTVRALFRSVGAGEVFDGSVAVMDIYAAQKMFSRAGRIDRIDMMNSPEVSSDELKKALSAQLPPGIRAVRPDQRGQSLENSVSIMHFGLTILSFLAFIICGFLIFNSFNVSLNQRRNEIGVLRSIGVTRLGIQAMFLAEAVVMGVIGSAIGLFGGYLLAKAALGVVLHVSATMYGFVSSPMDLEFNYSFAAQAFVIGIIASILAAWFPARAASRLDPVAALHNVETQGQDTMIGWPRLAIGISLVIAGLVLTTFSTPTVGMNIQLFYALIIQLGMILLLPKIIRFGATILRPIMNFLFGAEGLIAVETMARAPRRTASTVGALMVGLAFVFSCGAFVVSQKAAMNSSLDKAINADILIMSSEQLQLSPYHFSEATTERILALPGIEKADAVRVSSIEYRGESVTILGHDMGAYFSISPDLLDSGDPVFARDETVSGRGLLVSNNLALRWNVKLGDRIKLDAPGGSFEMPVVGMLNYYRSEVGTIFVDRSVYRRYWNDTDADYIFVDLRSDSDAQAFKQSVLGAISGEKSAFVYTHTEYKVWVNRLIDQFFTLMYLQMVVAVFVAALGLVNTMIISVDERRRELGIFRAIGGLRRQVIKIVLLEAVAISLIGLVTGALMGALSAYFLVNTAVKVVAGFTIHLVFPYTMVLAALPFVVIVAVISAILPAIKAARQRVVEAIGYE